MFLSNFLHLVVVTMLQMYNNILNVIMLQQNKLS